MNTHFTSFEQNKCI